jgi:hypothetical protein
MTHGKEALVRPNDEKIMNEVLLRGTATAASDPTWRTSGGCTAKTAPSGVEASDEEQDDDAPPRPPDIRRVEWKRLLDAAKKGQKEKVAAETAMADGNGKEAQQDQPRHMEKDRKVQADLSVVQPIDAVRAAKMPRLGEHAPPETRPYTNDGTMASKADVSSAAKQYKTTMPGAPRMPQTAAIAATKAPIALTAVTAMATGSEGAKACAGENTTSSGLQQLPAEVWAGMSRMAQKNYTRVHKKGMRK